MLEFLFILVVLFVCGLFFGKVDTKKELLNQVGLDLSESTYNSKKQAEFEKYCIKAMKKVICQDDYNAKTESQFLAFLEDRLNKAIWGEYWLGVSMHYVEHANRVVGRRQEDIKNGNVKLVMQCDFENKSKAKKYAELVWKKYQYPWPSNWMKRDGI